MLRRRELKSVANGMASFSVCRNNDIDGYWGLGVLCKYAEGLGQESLSFNIFSNEILPEPLKSYKRNLLTKFVTNKHILKDWISDVIVEFTFDAQSKSEFRGVKYKGSCKVSIVDDIQKRRVGTAFELCYCHNPKFERQSTRIPNYPIKSI